MSIRVYGWGNLAVFGMDSDTLVPERMRVLEEIGDVIDVRRSSDFAVILTALGAVYTMGSNISGCLGLGDIDSVDKPTRVAALEGMVIVEIAVGESHVLALTDDGAIYSWGRGDHGQLGHGNCETLRLPKRVHKLAERPVAHIEAQPRFSMAVSLEGDTYVWGMGGLGRLGTGKELTWELAPRFIPRLTGVSVVGLASSNTHAALITEGGELMTFGEGAGGALGTGDVQSGFVPGRVSLPPVQTPEGEAQEVALAASTGTDYTVVLAGSGEILSCGINTRGQLGRATDDKQDARVLGRVVLPPTGGQRAAVRHVACGPDWAAVTTEDGRVHVWGAGTHGQLGLGSVRDSPRPRPMGALEGKHVLRATCQRGCGFAFATMTDAVEPYEVFGNYCCQPR